MFRGTLIRSGNNAKTIKGDGEYETAIMYLAPANLALKARTVCPMAEQAGCIAGCLNTAGRGQMNNVQQARVNKTLRYLNDRETFMADLYADLERFVRYCKRKGVKPAVRLNGTSDIQWEVAHPVHGFSSIFDAFGDVQFYDYTKVYKRARRDLPSNYRLVLSYSEASPAYAEKVLEIAEETGCNVAVVYRTKERRDMLAGKVDDIALEIEGAHLTRHVIDGDSDDLRFLDPEGVIVGLYAKGSAKRDQSGFVIG